MYNAETKVPVALMKIMSVIQMLLSVIGVADLVSLLLIRQEVIDKVTSRGLMLDDSVKSDALNLTPVSIIISIILLSIGLVLAVMIFRNAILFTKGLKVSFAPFIYLIIVHISGVSIDILKHKEDPIAFSIIGTIILVCLIRGMKNIAVTRSNRKVPNFNLELELRCI